MKRVSLVVSILISAILIIVVLAGCSKVKSSNETTTTVMPDETSTNSIMDSSTISNESNSDATIDLITQQSTVAQQEKLDTTSLKNFLLYVIYIENDFLSVEKLKSSDYLSFVHQFLIADRSSDNYIFSKNGRTYCKLESIESITAAAFGKPFINHTIASDFPSLKYNNGVYEYTGGVKVEYEVIKISDTKYENGSYLVKFDIFRGYAIDETGDPTFICKAEARIKKADDSIFKYNVLALKRDLLPKQWSGRMEVDKLLKDNNQIKCQNGNWIYYVADGKYTKDSAIYKISTDGTGEKKIYEDEDLHFITGMQISGDWIYFNTATGAQASIPTSFIRIRTDGSGKQMLSTDTHIFSFEIKGDWIFYKRPQEDWNGDIPELKIVTYKMLTDGSQKQFVSNSDS